MRIFSNLATSLDGKIAVASRETFWLGTPLDRKTMQVVRKKVGPKGAILMGASTLRTFKGPLVIAGAKKQPLNVILSSRMEGVSTEWKFFTDPRISRLLFVAHDAPAPELRKLEATSEIVALAPPSAGRPVAVQVVAELKKRGVTKLLVEGGGGVMWDFVSQNLIDEYYVTLTPRLLGGRDAPTLVEGDGLGPDQVVNLKLKQVKKVGDELYLVYRKTARRGR